MYNIVRHTKKFNTDDQSDLMEYDAILSNPLCSIIKEYKEKLRQETYDEGKIVHSEEHVVLVVTWDEKTIL